MLTTNISSESISKTILDPNKSLDALSPKSHDDPRNPLRQPKHRNHEGSMEDQEEQWQWLEDVKNSYVVKWMDKDEALRVEPKLDLDPKGEVKSISLINMTHPSLEEALDKINPRVTNPRENLDIHEESTLELEREDDINEHGSYFTNTSSNPCSYEKSPKSIVLSNISTHEIFNPLILPVYKDFERVVVDVFVYHKYCKSHWYESWDRHTKVGVGGETTPPT